MERNRYNRIIEANESLLLEENNWWGKFAEYENRYSWVQPTEIQNIIRKRYVKKLKSLFKEDSKILELGCGTGWLLFMLAESGFTNLTGTDFSKEQLEIANSRKMKSPEIVKNSLKFSFSDSEDIIKESYDVVICHAFLHHLTERDIFSVVNFTKKQLNSNGKLIIWEPIKYSANSSRFELTLDFCLGLFLRFQGSWRKINDNETRLRTFRQRRNEGVSPNGPSPLEKPFAENEIESYLLNDFDKFYSQKFMAFSHKFAEELLLFKLSHPIIYKLIYRPVLKLIVVWEGLFLRSKSSEISSLWIFSMFIFNKKQ
jgi:2-polyprenyl-3-methyl-5-hydroxy-6-metoxy-1,4-benzoquinol methylase